MAQNTFALMTNLGRAKEAAAIANGTAVVITHIAIGDGTTVPSGGETVLYHETARKAVSGHGTVVGASNVAYFDIFLEAAEGPYTIREAGLIDQDGDLIAIARYDPPISKPIPSSGQTVEGTIRIEVAFSNIAAITIVVDPSFKVALQRINRLPWLPVLSLTLAEPPTTPSVGDVYIVPAGATGAWTGQSGKIAEYTSAGWGIISPPQGHGVSLPDGRVFEKIGGAYIEKIAIDVQSGQWNFAVAGGSANAITATLSPAVSENIPGMVVRIRTGASANTGPVTLDVGAGATPVVSMSGTPLQDGDIPPNTIIELHCNGTSYVFIGGVYSESVRPVTANMTLYVRSDGSDENDGALNTSARAMKTIQAAISRIMSRFITAGAEITIKVADGIYEPFELFDASGRRINIIGNEGAPSNCTISAPAGADAVLVRRNSDLFVSGFRVSGGKNLVSALDRSGIRLGTIEFGACSGYQIWAQMASTITLDADIRVIGSAQSMMVSTTGSVITASGRNISIIGALSFTQGTVWANGGVFTLIGTNFFAGSGSVTGPRYIINSLGRIYTNGGGENFIIGSIAGTFQPGGYYQ